MIVTLRMCFQLFSNSCYPVYIPSVSPFLVNFLADVPSVLLSVFRFSWIKNVLVYVVFGPSPSLDSPSSLCISENRS